MNRHNLGHADLYFDRAIETPGVGRAIFADTLSLYQSHHIINFPSDFQTFLRFCFVDRADYANKYSPQGNYFTCVQHHFTPFAFESSLHSRVLNNSVLDL